MTSPSVETISCPTCSVGMNQLEDSIQHMATNALKALVDALFFLHRQPCLSRLRPIGHHPEQCHGQAVYPLSSGISQIDRASLFAETFRPIFL